MKNILTPNRFLRALLLLLVILLIGGCNKSNQGKKYLIGFSQCGDGDRWRKAMIDEMKRELAFHPEMELIYKQADDSSSLQIRQVKELLDRKIDLLIISPNEAKPLTPIVEQAYDAGTPVIVVDRRTASTKYTNYIGADNFEIGKLAGAYTATLLKGSGRVIEVGGLPASSPAIERHRGFYEALKAFPQIVITQTLNGGWTKAQSKRMLEADKAELSTTDLIFAHNDVMAMGAYEVCHSSTQKNIKIIGVDALPGKEAGLQFIGEKFITASLLYPTGGAEAIRNAALILDKKPISKQTVLQTLIVDSTNVRMMSLQTEKISSQQVDIEKQQSRLTQQEKIYRSQQLVLYIVGSSLLLLLIFAGLLFYSRQLNRRINRELANKNMEVSRKSDALVEMSKRAEEAHEAKLDFFTNISHEFRTPLSLILGPVEEILKQPKLLPSVKMQLQLVQNNTLRLLRLVNQLIDFRKIEFNKWQVKAVETDLVSYTGQILEAFKSIAKKRGIDCRLLTSETAIRAWVDADMMDKILFNLLSNAFKFTEDGGCISITLEKNEQANTVRIQVEDNGIGMTPEQKERIFEMFYQASYGNHQGSGLGLPLTKQLVELHHGTINVESEKSKGTIFTIDLPLGKEHFSEDELSTVAEVRSNYVDEQLLLSTDLSPASTSYQPESNVEVRSETKASILIIEDNVELRSFLRNGLSPNYEVHEAANGIIGLGQVFDQMPDLIICDVMMPGKDGITLTSQIKKDIRTAHIPVVLLTANTSAEQQLQGYRTAADAYITKPFNFSILEETIESLLVNRKKLKDHFSSQLPETVGEKIAAKTDRRFLAEFTAIVEQNIPNEHFAVEDICKAMHLSKIQLYRKVRSLMDTNINEYILNIRIQKAKYYLHHEDLSISEIAFKTGFSSPAYFSTVFKNKTGVTPKGFRGS